MVFKAKENPSAVGNLTADMAFDSWLALDCKDSHSLQELLKTKGHEVSIEQLEKWSKHYRWSERYKIAREAKELVATSLSVEIGDMKLSVDAVNAVNEFIIALVDKAKAALTSIPCQDMAELRMLSKLIAELSRGAFEGRKQLAEAMVLMRGQSNVMEGRSVTVQEFTQRPMFDASSFLDRIRRPEFQSRGPELGPVIDVKDTDKDTENEDT